MSRRRSYKSPNRGAESMGLINPTQKTCMIDFMISNSQFSFYPAEKTSEDERKFLWRKLTEELNKLNLKCQKSFQDWEAVKIYL